MTNSPSADPDNHTQSLKHFLADLSAPAITSICGVIGALIFLAWYFSPHLTPACDSFSLLAAGGYGLSVFIVAVAEATRARNVWQLFGYWLGVALLGAALLFGLNFIIGLPICSGS